MNLRVSDRIRLKNDGDKSSSILSSPKLMASSKSLNNDYDQSSFLSPSARRKVTIMSHSDNELSFISPSSKKKSLMLTDPKQIIKSNVTSKSITSTKRSLASDYNNEASNKLIESSPVKIKNETRRALWETSDTIFSPLNKRKCNKRMYDDDDDGSLQNYDTNDIDVIKLQTEKNMVNNLLNASTEEEKLFICKKLGESWAGIKDVDDDNEEEEDDDDEDDYQNDNIENQYYRHLYLKESI